VADVALCLAFFTNSYPSSARPSDSSTFAPEARQGKARQSNKIHQAKVKPDLSTTLPFPTRSIRKGNAPSARFIDIITCKHINPAIKSREIKTRQHPY